MPTSHDLMIATLDALAKEGDVLENLVKDIDDATWAHPTPAHGWSIAHQIAHLSWTDEAASASLCSTIGDGPFASYELEPLSGPDSVTDRTAEEGAASPPSELLERWGNSRRQLDELFRQEARLSPRKYPWFGPPMGLRSMATARLMETWAHGQDVADALGVERPLSDGLRDICHLGVVTRDYSYDINGLTAPEGMFLIELESPDGGRWSWGPDDSSAIGTVRGPALDFCLLVSQRREVEDLSLTFEGEEPRRWSGFAQIFAGPPKSVVRNRGGRQRQSSSASP